MKEKSIKAIDVLIVLLAYIRGNNWAATTNGIKSFDADRRFKLLKLNP